MRKTYEMTFNAPTNEQTEHAAKLMDTIFRQWYNVYGGKRAYSGKGAGGEWYIFMEYTADWETNDIWPDFNDLKKYFFQKLARVDRNDMVEVQSRPMPWRD